MLRLVGKINSGNRKRRYSGVSTYGASINSTKGKSVPTPTKESTIIRES